MASLAAAKGGAPLLSASSPLPSSASGVVPITLSIPFTPIRLSQKNLELLLRITTLVAVCLMAFFTRRARSAGAWRGRSSLGWLRF